MSGLQSSCSTYHKDMKCKHKEFHFSKKNEINFCELCGVIMFHNKALTVKPEVLNYKVEINPHEIFENMNKSESNGKTRNFYINEIEREEIIKLLKKFVIKYRLSDKSFYLSVLFIDIITSSNFYRRYKSEIKSDLLSIGCLLIAAKYSENDPSLPNLREIQVFTQSYYYHLKEIVKYEEMCVKILAYKLDYYTPFDYIQFMLVNGFIFVDEINSIQPHTIENIYQQCHLFLADFVCDIAYRDFSSIQIACSCIYLVREILKLEFRWNRILEKIYEISFEDFSECYEILKKYLNYLID